MWIIYFYDQSGLETFNKIWKFMWIIYFYDQSGPETFNKTWKIMWIIYYEKSKSGTERLLAPGLPHLPPLWPARCWQGFLKGFLHDDHHHHLDHPHHHQHHEYHQHHQHHQRLMVELCAGSVPPDWSRKERQTFAKGDVFAVVVVAFNVQMSFCLLFLEIFCARSGAL